MILNIHTHKTRNFRRNIYGGLTKPKRHFLFERPNPASHINENSLTLSKAPNLNKNLLCQMHETNKAFLLRALKPGKSYY